MAKQAVTASNKTIAKTLAGLFGGTARVIRYWDDPHTTSTHILECPDRPWPGVTTYATVGLSDSALVDPEDGQEYPVRLEIIGAAGSTFTAYPNAIATSAFNIIKDREFCFPGRIFPGAVALNDRATAVPHLIFVEPFLWDDQPQTMDLPDKQVAFLQAVPISDSEADYVQAEGPGALLDLFVERQPDTFDPDRSPVV